MHTILFLPNDHMLCWAGRVPPGTPLRALVRRIEQEAPRQVQRLAQWEGGWFSYSHSEERELPGDLEPLDDREPPGRPEPPDVAEPQARDFPAGMKPPAGGRNPFGADLAENCNDGGMGRQGVGQARRRDNPPGAGNAAGPLGEEDWPPMDVRGILAGRPDLDEAVQVGNSVIAMSAVLYVLVGAGMAAARESAREAARSAARSAAQTPDRERTPDWHFGLAQRFVVPANLALRVDILSDVLLVRADPPMLPCMGGTGVPGGADAPGGKGRVDAPRIPTLSADERAVLAALSREKSVRAVQKKLGCSRRRIFYVLASARRKVGRLMRELRTGSAG